MNGLAILERGDGRELLKKYCRSIGVSIRTLEDLVRIELEQVGRVRRRGMFPRFDEVLSNDSDPAKEA